MATADRNPSFPKLAALLTAIALMLAAPFAKASDPAPKFSPLVPYENPQPLALPPMEAMLKAAGLDGEIDKLKAHAAAVEDIYQYAPRHKTIGPSYMLAPDRLAGVSELYPQRNAMAHWSEGYREYRIATHGEGHTAKYMDAITKSGKTVVFFVPPNIMGRPGITRNEMQWLLDNPERMQNVRFVFGTYDVFSAELVERLLYTRETGKMLQLLGPPEGRPTRI